MNLLRHGATVSNKSYWHIKINRPMSFRAKRGIFERFFVTSFLRMTKGNFRVRIFIFSHLTIRIPSDIIIMQTGELVDRLRGSFINFDPFT